MNKKVLSLLYRSFDDTLTEAEQRCLNEALKTSAALREEKERLSAMRGDVASLAATSFAPGFTERVMRRLDAEPAQTNGGERFFAALIYLFRRVAIAAAVAIVALVVFNLQGGDSLSLESAFGRTEVTIAEVLESPYYITME